jgi:hypothetical protein
METIIGMVYLFVIPCTIAIVVNVVAEKYFQNRDKLKKIQNNK